MKKIAPAVWLALLLALSFCAGRLITQRTHAQSLTGLLAKNKASSDLIRKTLNGQGAERVRVIIQPASAWSETLNLAVLLQGGTDVRQFQNFNFRVVSLPAAAATALAQRSDVSYVSLNYEVRTLGHVSATSGADAVRNQNGTNTSGPDGTGIGIAVFDSGIDSTHKAFLDKSNNVRVVASQDFTGENRTDDPYGHGTHVSSILAGNGRISNASYTGIAPNANIINMRVLNSQGVGSASQLLKAVDWVLTNRARFNIRVVNMSLG
ncbi:MAG TPA: S8 family serine peptidase, partial [Pyrinomonadaceae bacterium]|nr:S8 family serine peptidase [Pyrinomonadaceae bacterium]